MRPNHPRRMMIGITLVLLLVAAACSGQGSAETTTAERGGVTGFIGDTDGTPETTTTMAPAAQPPAADSGEEDGASEESVPGGGGEITAAVQTTSDLGRDIIFTAELTVAVNDVAAAGREATRIVQSLGGFTFGQQTTGSPEPRTVLTFKVFPEDFSEALDRLGSIGELRGQNISASDVTDRVVDLQSRINTAEASVERLRTFLSQAQDIDVIAELENQLLDRETQLETLRGQLRTVQDQVALATIVLTVTEATTRPGLRLDVSAYPGHDGEGLSCPGTPGLSVDEGTEVTMCFEVVNVGDTAVSGLTMRDPILDIDREDLIVVFGDPDAVMEPGQSVLFAYELTADRDLRTQTTATAVPVDEDGNPLPGRDAATTTSILIDAVDPGGLPSFRDGLAASWDVLVGLGRLIVLIAGWLLPFLWVPALVWIGWSIRRRRVADAAHTSPDPDTDREPEPEPAGAGRSES